MKQYLDIVREVLEEGEWKDNRTGVRTKAIAGAIFRHDMATGFPLLTTKKIPFRLVASELEFFIKGLTDKKWLQDRNNHIWDSWATPAVVKDDGTSDTRAKMFAERDLGNVYGWNWRHFGAGYIPLTELLSGEVKPGGVDQLKSIVETLKTNPNDRRMICTAWDPSSTRTQALPACHYGFQVTVINGKLNLLWNQRSVDVGLGLPFNIASYALLLELLCLESGLKPGKLVGFLADVHIYENHIEGLTEQLSREPKALPELVTLQAKASEELTREGSWSMIDHWEYTDSHLVGYDPHPTIKFEVAV